VSAPAAIVDRVRQRLAAGAPADLDELVRAESPGIVDDAVLDALRSRVRAELAGAGPLEPLLALPGVTDVLVNGPRSVWIDRGNGLEAVPVSFPDDAAVRRLAQRLIAAAGRRLDDATPFADATLPDGTRLHALLPPLVPACTLSFRVLGRQRFSVDDLTTCDALPQPAADLLRSIVRARLAFVLSGGTGSGKTTLLGALLAEVPGPERLVVIEDARELSFDHPHVVRLVTRAANVEGAGAVGLRELVRQALRMRPDRVAVGEFRGAETVELLVALNTGHEGGAATVHANSASDVPSRLTALGSLGGVGPATVVELAGSALDVVVHLARARDGRRQLREVGLLRRGGRGGLEVLPVWTRAGGIGPAAGALAAALAARGVDPPAILGAGCRPTPVAERGAAAPSPTRPADVPLGAYVGGSR
jgi:pilus assembly protein CpaF